MSKAIGDIIYWVESSANYGKEIPCPMCFGKRFVTLILGDDSKCEIECGYCSHGVDRPSGIAKTWEPHAAVRSGKITGISTRDGIRYEAGYTSLYAHETYDSQAIADEVCKSRLEEVKKHAEEWHIESFVNCKKKQIWSAGYHRESIKSAERNIEWHKMRLNMIKEKNKQGGANNE